MTDVLLELTAVLPCSVLGDAAAPGGAESRAGILLDSAPGAAAPRSVALAYGLLHECGPPRLEAGTFSKFCYLQRHCNNVTNIVVTNMSPHGMHDQ